MSDKLAQCDFPELDEPYAIGLHEAVEYIIERFNPIGIIAAGSIVWGHGDPRSDIDTFVLIDGDYRQRVQTYFNDVRFEIFVNPPSRIRRYFTEELADGGGSTLHMFARGHVVYDNAPILQELITEAQDILEKGTPNPSETQLNFMRYMAADRVENALDLRYRDPAMAMVLFTSAFDSILSYYFLKQRKWVPRHKEILSVLRQENPALARLIDDFWRTTGDARFEIAKQIADLTLETRGFYTWETDPEKVE